jgi:hypothetical protein
MSDRPFRSKSPRTYRKEYPGKHVIALMALSPSGDDILFEGAVPKELHDRLIAIYIEHMKNEIKEHEQKEHEQKKASEEGAPGTFS